MADEGVERLDPSSVEIKQGGFPEEVDPHQFLLADQFGLDVHGLFVVDLEHHLAMTPLGGNDLGYGLRYLLLLEAVNQVLQALEVLAIVLALATGVDDVSGVGPVFDELVLRPHLSLKTLDGFLKNFLKIPGLTLQHLNLEVDAGEVVLFFLLELSDELSGFPGVFANGLLA